MVHIRDIFKRFMESNEDPVQVSIFTMPNDGRNPAEYTAGFFCMVADKVEFPYEGCISFQKKGCDMERFDFVETSIELIGVEDDSIGFKYHNLKVVNDYNEFYGQPVVFVKKIMPS